MTYTIAITGKGGVGKTTVAALLVARLIERGCKPVLAVDADPNSCLDQALGVKVAVTVGGIREEARQIAGKGMSTGVPTQKLLEMKISQSLVEADDFDLIAMGRPEGPGCYCYANSVLRQTIQTIASNYPYLVIDNEAGLENISRRVVTQVDLMVIVSDPSQRGVETIRRLYDLAQEMGTKYGKLALAINRMGHADLPAGLEQLRDYTKASYILGLSDDPQLAAANEAGTSLRHLPADNPVIRRLDAFLEEVGLAKARVEMM